MNEQNLSDLMRKGTEQEFKSLAIRPKTMTQEYREAWQNAAAYCKRSRAYWSDAFKNPTNQGWPPWMTFPDFIDRRLKERFGEMKTWDSKLKKRIWNEFPEFRMTEKEWRPKN